MELKMTVQQERRDAIYTPVYDRPRLKLTAGTEYACVVHGLFQCTDEDDVNPYFVIELQDGSCTYAAPEQVRFIEYGHQEM